MQSQILTSFQDTPSDKPFEIQNLHQIAMHTPSINSLQNSNPGNLIISESIALNREASELDRSHYYLLSADILKHTSIAPPMRAKLRHWITQQTSSHDFSREVCCLANTFIDLYFSKKAKVEVKAFHSLGIACLILANKLIENRTISVNYLMFPKQMLEQLQRQIIIKLNFNLTPHTYVQKLNEILVLWDRFAFETKLKCFYTSNSASDENSCRWRCSKIYQFLDLVFMIQKSLRFQQSSLIFQSFKIFFSQDYSHYLDNNMISEEKQQTSARSFQNILGKFVQYCNSETISFKLLPNKVVQEYLTFLTTFIDINRCSERPLKNQLLYQSYRVEFYEISKKIMKALSTKGKRKSSLETTLQY